MIVDGGWENEHDTILGADNKAAVAVMLEVARRASIEGSPVGIELLFTVAEEDGLRGAKAFDVSKLRSDWGYVFDHASPIGEVDRRLADLLPAVGRLPRPRRSRRHPARGWPQRDPRRRLRGGRDAARAHRRPHDRERRLDPRRRRVHQRRGRALPDHGRGPLARLRPRRDRDRGDGRRGATTARRRPSATSTSISERLFDGYRQKPSSSPVVAAEAALQACGYEPSGSRPAAASDANALEANGFTCVNLANGTEHNHEPNERVSVVALEGMLDVALALLDACAEQPA